MAGKWGKKRKKLRRRNKNKTMILKLAQLVLVLAVMVKIYSFISGSREYSHMMSDYFIQFQRSGKMEKTPFNSGLHQEIDIPENIRVIINDSTMENLYHSRMDFSAASELALREEGTGREYNYPEGTRFRVETQGKKIKVVPHDSEPKYFENRVRIVPAESEAIVWENLQREGWGSRNPRYQGVVEINPRQGKFVVINELPLEDYLGRVVPSEMPRNFELEALKAQAVAARSYAYRAVNSSKRDAYDAHLDDSISTQVYNNSPGSENIKRAVKETEGEVVFNDGRVVDARYFSTSCGHTAGFGEVWGCSHGEFPGPEVSYLQADSQVPGENLSLKSEGTIRRFLQQAPEDAYDYDSPFFRWEVEMSREELQASIERNLPRRYKHDPSSILTLSGREFASKSIPPDPLGELKEIQPVKRGEGGNLKVIELEGTKGTYRVKKEYNIRFTLRPVQYLKGHPPVTLERHRAEPCYDYEVLPSAFACLEETRDKKGRLKKVTIMGGGSGHGVGMSQYGANGMAKQGSNYREILEHYYPGVEVKNIG